MTAIEQATEQRMQADPAGVETGEFIAGEVSSALPTRFVFATYNIRYARGPGLISGGLLRKIGVRFGNRRATTSRNLCAATEAFARLRPAAAPSVIALQESDRETARAAGLHVTREFAAHLKMAYAFAEFEKPADAPPLRKQWYLDFAEPVLERERGTTGIAALSTVPMANVARIELPWQHCR